MKTEVKYRSDQGLFEVTVWYAYENQDERKDAAVRALREAKVPECVDRYSLRSYRLTRYEADPLIADFFQRAGLAFSEHDVARMDWASINELIRYVRAYSVVVAL